jgi:hypothetical protein
MSGNISYNYSNPSGIYYYGSHYGNKASGRNIKYATDPYWGEKMAENYFLIDNTYGRKEYNSKTIGINQSNSEIKVAKSPSVTDLSNPIYTVKNNYYNKTFEKASFIILDRVTGEAVNGNKHMVQNTIGCSSR